jgi:hypothetical protein
MDTEAAGILRGIYGNLDVEGDEPERPSSADSSHSPFLRDIYVSAHNSFIATAATNQMLRNIYVENHSAEDDSTVAGDTESLMFSSSASDGEPRSPLSPGS